MDTGPAPAPSPSVGVGLKPHHYEALLDPDCLLRVAPIGSKSIRKLFLEMVVRRTAGWPPSPNNIRAEFHSVGLSLGSVDGLNAHDLDRVAYCASDTSLHRCPTISVFPATRMTVLPDLLPVPHTRARRPFRGRDRQGAGPAQAPTSSKTRRAILPIAATRWAKSNLSSASSSAAGAGCCSTSPRRGLRQPIRFMPTPMSMPSDADWVGEIHSAGHAVEQHDSGPLLIDDHGSRVTEAMAALSPLHRARRSKTDIDRVGHRHTPLPN